MPTGNAARKITDRKGKETTAKIPDPYKQLKKQGFLTEHLSVVDAPIALLALSSLTRNQASTMCPI